MTRNYKNTWNAKKLEINFNQKQWRQDLASFIVVKLQWLGVKTSRSKVIEKDFKDKNCIREFEIFDDNNNSCTVKYTNKNEIIDSSHRELINEYMSMKGI